MNTMQGFITEAPVPGAVKLEPGLNCIGLQDGQHTGGVWHDVAKNEVWKPLVDRNGHPTKEVEAIRAGFGLPLFDEVWRVEEAHGIKWLVRPFAHTMPEHVPYTAKGIDFYLTVEAAVRDYNRRGWEVNDEIKIGFLDVKGHPPVILDLSIAQPMNGTFKADDSLRINRLFEAAGHGMIVKRRKAGQDLVGDQFAFVDKYQTRFGEYCHVYGSYYRPMSRMWATRLPADAILIDNGPANWSRQIPHTWIVTPTPLDSDVIDAYQLAWAWSPVHEPKVWEN
jgi:hypothetical protein